MTARVATKPPNLAEHLGDIPPELSRFVDQMLAKNPEQRPATPAPLATFYDADLTACISNIAQIVVLRLNLGDGPSCAGTFLRRVLTQTVMSE